MKRTTCASTREKVVRVAGNNASFVNYCATVVSYLRYVMGFTHMDFYIGESNVDASPNSNEDTGTAAAISCDTRYSQHRITVYPILANSYDKGELEDVATAMLHELCHVFFAPLQELTQQDVGASLDDLIQHHVEQNTEHMKRVVASLLPEGWWKPEQLARFYKAASNLFTVALNKGGTLAKKKCKTGSKKGK